MPRVSLLSWSLGTLLLGATGACAATADDPSSSDDELVASQWIGTYRNNAATNGQLRTLTLKGDGTAAVVVQQCTATACSSVQIAGTYSLGERKAGAGGGKERTISLDLGSKKLAYRSRLEGAAATVDGSSLALLELDANGVEKQPFVSIKLTRSAELFCSAPKDCQLQSGSRGPATDCIANTCVWGAGPVCSLKATATELVADAAVAPGAPTGRRLPSSAWTGSGLFVFGGRAPDDTLLSDGAIFDPATNTWQALATTGAPSAREHADAAAASGKVIVAGGWNDDGVGILHDVHLYDVATKKWSTLTVPASVAADWIGEFYSVGGALYRSGFKHLLYRVDVKTKAITAVTDPPEALALRAGEPSGGIVNNGMMKAVVGDSLAIFHLVGKAEGAWDHNVWRLFALDGSTGKWSVSDVGLGRIGTYTPAGVAGNNVVFVNGNVARSQAGGGTVATLDMTSKTVKVTQIGNGDSTSAFGWLELFGSATSPNPVAFVREDDHVELDTLDLSRAWFAHQSSWQGTPPPRPRLPLLFENVQVWSGKELLVWGGRAEQTVNGFKVVSFPQNVIRYTPSGCP